MFELDYNAGVPGLDRKDAKGAPFVVNINPRKAPGVRFRDYIPNPAKKLGPPKKKQPEVHGRVVVEDVDYRSYEDTLKVKASRKTMISGIVETMMKDKAKLIRNYRIACKILKKATPEELEDPSKRIQKALKIKARGHPCPRGEAERIAERQIIGRSR